VDAEGLGEVEFSSRDKAGGEVWKLLATDRVPGGRGGRGVFELLVVDACTVVWLVLPSTPDPKVTDSRCGCGACHATAGQDKPKGSLAIMRNNFVRCN
jgi:hypothetical protein